MKATNFYSIKSIKGNEKDFHRKSGKFCKRGVYFWGFTLRKDGSLPLSKEDLVIYYIGKSEKNIVERIMQEVTQLIFGGFGTIIDHNWLIKKTFEAKIFEKQESDKKGTKLPDPEVLYKSNGLHLLYDFFGNPKIQPTIDWMRERLIFAWIDDENDKSLILKPVENEMHHIVRTNVLGIGNMKNATPKKDITIPANTPFFNSIDWKSNLPLKEWLIEVNSNIPK